MDDQETSLSRGCGSASCFEVSRSSFILKVSAGETPGFAVRGRMDKTACSLA
jgi:hypothetical protein